MLLSFVFFPHACVVQWEKDLEKLILISELVNAMEINQTLIEELGLGSFVVEGMTLFYNPSQ